jgi:hypothetical protein
MEMKLDPAGALTISALCERKKKKNSICLDSGLVLMNQLSYYSATTANLCIIFVSTEIRSKWLRIRWPSQEARDRPADCCARRGGQQRAECRRQE